MRRDKYARMMAAYDGFKGAQTVTHVLSTIPDELISGVPGRQAGQIMSVRNAAYHEGMAAGEKHEQTDECVFNGQDLIPLEIIKKIKVGHITDSKIIPCNSPSHYYDYRTIYRDPEGKELIFERLEAMHTKSCWMSDTHHITTYTLDAQDIC